MPCFCGQKTAQWIGLRHGEVPALHMDSPSRSPIYHHKSGGIEIFGSVLNFPKGLSVNFTSRALTWLQNIFEGQYVNGLAMRQGNGVRAVLQPYTQHKQMVSSAEKWISKNRGQKRWCWFLLLRSRKSDCKRKCSQRESPKPCKVH